MTGNLNNWPNLFAVPVACIILKQNGIIDQANPAAARLLGVQNGRFSPQPFTEFVLAADHSTLTTLLQETAVSPHETSAELRLLTANGQPLWVQAAANALPDEAGYCLVLTDIDAYKQREADTWPQAQLLDNLSDAVVTTDLDFVIRSWNKGAEIVYGWTTDEVIGKRFPEVIPTSYPHNNREQVLDAFRQNGYWQGEVIQQTKDGRFRHIFSTATWLRDNNDNLIGTMAINQDITERKQAEKYLQRNEQILRLFVKYSPAALAMFDREMNYIVASRRYLIDYDLGEQELIGRSHHEVFPEASDRWQEIYQLCLAGEVLRADEDPFPRADGRLDWVRWEIRPWHEENGQIGGIILFSEVITKQKQAEIDLQQAKSRYQMLVEQNPAVIYLDNADEAGTNSYISPQVEKLLGYGAAAYTENPNLWHEQIFPGDYDVAVGSIKEVLATGQSVVEYRLLRRDGRIVWVRDSSVLVRDKRGKPEFIQGFLEDITERKEAETELRETQSLLSSLLEHAPVSIFVDTLDNRLRLANKRWEEDMQIHREEAIGRSIDELYSPELAQRYRQENEQVIAEGPVAFEKWAQTPHGRRRYHTVKFPIPGADEEITAVGGVAIDTTRQAETEAKLRESEERFRLLLENAPGALTLLRRDGSRKFVSESTERVMGYRPQDIVDGRLDDLTHPDDVAALQEVVQKIQQQPGAVRTVQYRFKHKDGSWRWVESTISNLLHIPAIEALAFNFQDITDRKQYEESLRQNQALLRIAGTTARLGGWIVDLETDQITWSDQVCAIHEVPAGTSPTQEEVLNYYTPAYRSQNKAIFAACAQEGIPYDEEMQITTATGRLRWVRTIGRAVRDNAGNIVRVQGAFQDITAQREIEDLLFESQQQFRQLTNAMPLIVWTARPDGTVDYANQFLADYTGVPDMDLPAQQWLSVLHPDDVDRCLAAWGQAVATGTLYTIEWRLRRHDGCYRWHTVQATPIRNYEDKIIKWYGTAIDIHDSRAMEEEMRQLASRLATTLESITDGFHTLDHDWRITYINQEAERIMGRTSDELLGKVIWEEFQQAVDTTFYHEYHRALRENKAVAFEEFYPPLDRWLDVSVYPSEEGLTIYFRDITERKEAEKQLQQQLEELRRWYRATLGREMRILDLKQEVNALLVQAGQTPRYPSVEER